MARSPKFLFCIRTSDAHGCYHLEVRVRTFQRLPQFNTTDTGRSSLIMTWQANRESPTEWYGFRMNIEDTDGAGTILETWAPVLRKIGGANIPHAVLAVLESCGAVQGDWSTTIGRFLPLPELPAPGTRSYMDAGSADGYCSVHAYVPPIVGPDAEGAATSAVSAAFAAYVARNPSRMDRLEAWIAAGKPVRYLEQEGEHSAPWRDLTGWRRILPEAKQEGAA